MKSLIKLALSFGLVVFTIGTGALANAKTYQTQLKTNPLLIASSSSSQPGRRTDPAYTVPSMVTGDFEIWLIVDSNTRIHSGYLVHAWIALVVTSKGNGGQVLATRGFTRDYDLVISDKWEMAKTQAFIGGERQAVDRVAVKVSRSKAEFIMSNPGYAGCSKYEVSSSGTNCNCSQFASRLFHYTTNVRYNHALRRYITSNNRASGTHYVNNGRVLN